MKIGTKIYFDKTKNDFGNIILQLGDCELGGVNSTLEQDYMTFKDKEFSQISIDDIGLITYEFGEWNIVSKDATSWYVDTEKDEVVFDYTPIPIIPQEPSEIEIMQEKISILEAENKSLREGLQAVLSGDMQSLAYILYPEDFTDIDKDNTTLEL